MPVFKTPGSKSTEYPRVNFERFAAQGFADSKDLLKRSFEFKRPSEDVFCFCYQTILAYLKKDKKNWPPKDQFPVELLFWYSRHINNHKARFNMSKIVSQSIAYWTKNSHIHRIQVAFQSKDIPNFILQFLYLAVDSDNECVYEKPITSIIADLTGWPRKSITNAMNVLIDNGEFERFKTKGMKAKAVRLNHDIANRQRWGVFDSKYTGKKPQYSDKQKELADKLKPFIQEVNRLARSEADMTHDLLMYRIERLERKVEKLTGANDYLMERVNKEDAKKVRKIFLVPDLIEEAE